MSAFQTIFGSNLNNMKKLICISIIFLPFLTFSQELKLPLISLRTLDNRNVQASELVQDGQAALVYFFNDLSSETDENLEYLQNLDESKEYGSQVRIIAVYNATNGSYGNLNAFLNGNAISLETYIDVNGELQRSLGLPVNSTALLSSGGTEMQQRFTGVQSCSGELTSMVSSINAQEFEKSMNQPGNSEKYYCLGK
jgi:hypothetical protein